MEFQALVEKAREVNALYDQLNKEQGHSEWSLEHYVLGLMEDLGSLSRLVMMKAGIRKSFDDFDEKLRHEVCDCLWATIRIADKLNIDLESEFPKQMEKLAKRVREEKR